MILFQVCSINEASNQMHVFFLGSPLKFVFYAIRNLKPPIFIQCAMHGAFSAHILDITCKYKYISSGILVQNAYRYKKKPILLLILHPLIYSFLAWLLLSLPCQRQWELLLSLGVHCLLTSHFNLRLWYCLDKVNRDFVGSIYGRSSIKIAHFVPTNVCTYPIIIQCVMHGAFSAHILDITCKYKYISSGILVQNAYRYKKKTYYWMFLVWSSFKFVVSTKLRIKCMFFSWGRPFLSL
jgi:hypothetical protein